MKADNRKIPAVNIHFNVKTYFGIAAAFVFFLKHVFKLKAEI